METGEHRLATTSVSRWIRRSSDRQCSKVDLSIGIDKVESIEVHDLVPRGHEVAHELLLRVVARIDLRERTELRVRTEDQVDAATGPLALAGLAIAELEGVRRFRPRPPLHAHVEEVHEEVVGQHPGPLCEYAKVRLRGVRAQGTQPAYEHGHLRRAQRQPEC